MAASMDVNVSDAQPDAKVFPTFVERYFTPRYKADVNGRQGEDFCILQHSNKICVIALARGHPILRDKHLVDQVDFQVSPNTNRIDNKVIGKSKKGAQYLREDSPLCTVRCTDGASFVVYPCVRGKLVEVNEMLVHQPQLLTTKPNTEGYVAIVLLRLGDCDQQLQGLLSEEEYGQILLRRERQTTETPDATGQGASSSPGTCAALPS
ncbi:protein Abitram-like [Diadema setosum]|uniref:protein Abitram-like n=1 Tax=Diadema setosum TaxID=31175 RepID=UPI003B3B4A9A